ncbi:MAG: sarcosine oxidase [Marinomonadaceae bacterium]
MSFFNVSAAPNFRRSILTIKPTITTSTIQLEDASVQSRVGFRGKGVEAFLAAHQVNVPAEPNQAITMEQGICILRLSNSEFWVIDNNNMNHDLIQTLEQSSAGVEDVYRLYCQHSHGVFSLTGAPIRDMFAKVCGVDLSLPGFSAGSIAQTSVARINAIVVCLSAGESESFLLLFDVASSDYFWEAISDSAAEFV